MANRMEWSSLPGELVAPGDIDGDAEPNDRWALACGGCIIQGEPAEWLALAQDIIGTFR